MSQLDQSSPVGQWVAEYPRTASVFEELQIDYCCGGDKPLVKVCQIMGLDPTSVAKRLNDSLIEIFDDARVDYSNMALSELCDHIEATHHIFLKTELPRLARVVEKVADVHGQAHPELLQLHDTYNGLREELEPHMMKEEKILFPAIRLLEQSTAEPQMLFGPVANPIQMMRHEHDNAGNALKQIRRLANNFVAEDQACNTWRAMLDGLQSLEHDLHQHIHKENNILFPRAELLDAGYTDVRPNSH